MATEPTNPEPSIDELVAYLDGELDVESARRIDERLATDAKVRATLQRLEQAWNMLDHLDRPSLTAHFAESTMEMVAVAARKEAEQTLMEIPRRRRRGRAILAGGLLAAGLAGFLTVGFLLPDPNEQLLRDLPMLLNLDQYCRFDKEAGESYVEDVEFLQMLKTAKLPSPATSLAGGAVSGPSAASEKIDDESLAERERMVREMPQDKKDRLAKAQSRFRELSPEQQEQVRKLHEQLETLPNGPELRGIMEQYHAWLRTLPESKTDTLLALEPQARLEAIRRYLAEQPRPFVRPTEQDIQGLMRWLEAFVDKNREEVLKGLPGLRDKFAETSDPMRRRALALLAWQRFQSLKGKPPLSPEDLDALLKSLSPETRQRLESLSDSQRRETLGYWLQIAHQKIADQRFREIWMKVDEKELNRFFREELSEEERQRFLRIEDPQERKQELGQLYTERLREMIEPLMRRPGEPGADRIPGRFPGTFPPSHRGGHRGPFPRFPDKFDRPEPRPSAPPAADSPQGPEPDRGPQRIPPQGTVERPGKSSQN